MPNRKRLKIRALQVSDGDLAAGDIGRIAKVFDQVAASPGYSRTLRGGIALSFGGYEREPRPNFEYEAVRRYTRLIDARYPFFAYFLPRDPALHQIFGWMASLATPLEPGPHETEGIAVDPEEFTAIVVARIAAVREFCDRIQDDPQPTIDAIMEAMPEEVARAARERFAPASQRPQVRR